MREDQLVVKVWAFPLPCPVYKYQVIFIFLASVASVALVIVDQFQRLLA
jgi:hypothetical protein